MTVLERGTGRPGEVPPEPALKRAVALLVRLLDDQAFVDSQVLPLLEEASGSRGWYVNSRRELPDGSSLQVFVWPPGSKTRIHDHSSWGAFCCASGRLLEERYERLDDGSQEGCARLRKLWEREWGREDGTAMVLPYGGGIHRVGNLGAKLAVSVHLYGPWAGDIDGRDYDPSRDFVCERRDDPWTR